MSWKNLITLSGIYRERKISKPTLFLGTFLRSDNFLKQLVHEQSEDQIIRSPKQSIANKEPIARGRLKRVQKQLRIERKLLVKSGRSVVPASLHQFNVAEYHNSSHFGADKVYALLKQRFYWPNMFKYLQSFIANCQVCQTSKSNKTPPKSSYAVNVPTAPMQL